MTKNKYLLGILASMALSANAQNDASKSAGTYKLFPNDQIEVGINVGLAQVHGDFGGFTPGFGVGLHVRKALDYTWSVRADIGYDNLKSKSTNGKPVDAGSGSPGGSTNAKEVVTSMPYGAVHLVASLNNNRWENGIRKVNPYVYAGVGFTSLSTKVNSAAALANVDKTAALINLGAGLNFRISDKMNFGLDARVTSLFGKRMDLVDAYAYRWKDLMSNLSARLNFNLGGKSGDGKTAKSLPLWWVNPAAKINADIAEIAARPKLDLTDTDGDGVIDMLDQEKDTPAGARVDTRGVALDSDGDSVPDYKDKEPFSPPGYKYDGNGVAQVTKPTYVTQAEVDKAINDKLKNWEVSNPGRNSGGTETKTTAIVDWFLPMIHFDFASASIRQADVPSLYNVATVMKNNPGLRVVVTGYTDKVSDEATNQGLSYRRAEAAIEHLISKYGIDRSRLVLNYSGENNLLVNTKDKNIMNRRVEFKVAQSETEMGAPAKEMKRKKTKGGKNAGY